MTSPEQGPLEGVAANNDACQRCGETPVPRSRYCLDCMTTEEAIRHDG